jgi:hypothetical protein
MLRRYAAKAYSLYTWIVLRRKQRTKKQRKEKIISYIGTIIQTEDEASRPRVWATEHERVTYRKEATTTNSRKQRTHRIDKSITSWISAAGQTDFYISVAAETLIRATSSPYNRLPSQCRGENWSKQTSTEKKMKHGWMDGFNKRSKERIYQLPRRHYPNGGWSRLAKSLSDEVTSLLSSPLLDE